MGSFHVRDEYNYDFYQPHNVMVRQQWAPNTTRPDSKSRMEAGKYAGTTILGWKEES